jgi:hypothetical protein
MRSHDLRKSRDAAVTKDGRVEWRSVIGISFEGQLKPGKALRDGISALGPCVTGVRIKRVLTMSNGARMYPATPAASTTTPILIAGFGLSRIPGLPTPCSLIPVWSIPGSGMFRSADRQLRNHVSMVRYSTPYTKVEFVAFHTPNTPSLPHNCEMTSKIESGCDSVSTTGA